MSGGGGGGGGLGLWIPFARGGCVRSCIYVGYRTESLPCGIVRVALMRGYVAAAAAAACLASYNGRLSYIF